MLCRPNPTDPSRIRVDAAKRHHMSSKNSNPENRLSPLAQAEHGRNADRDDLAVRRKMCVAQEHRPGR